jgi:hypothetical protein
MTFQCQERIIANGLMYLAATQTNTSPRSGLVKEAAEAALRIIENRNEAAAIEKLIFYLISPKDIVVARQKANAKYAQIRADVELAKSCVMADTHYYT